MATRTDPVDTEVDTVQLVFADDNADGSTVDASLSNAGSNVPCNAMYVGATDRLDTGLDTDPADTGVLTTDFGGTETITDYVGLGTLPRVGFQAPSQLAAPMTGPTARSHAAAHDHQPRRQRNRVV